jgi:flagellin
MSVINTNVKALVAQESMRSNNLKLSTTMERLATGLRINSAKDDAAGLAISNRMTAQVRGFTMAIKNANDGVSMAQTADGAYNQVTSMLQRMRELSVQAANGSMSDADRGSIQLEIDELKMEIDNVANKTHFNNIKLLDGSAKNIKLQTGANEGDLMDIGFDSVKTKDIGSGARPALTSVGGAVTATTNNSMASGDLVLNGVLVGASLATDDTKSFGDRVDATQTDSVATSAIAKAAAINRVSDQSGVFAKVNDTQVRGSVMTAAALTGTITINGVATASITTTEDAEVSRGLVANAINNISTQTGVRAVNTGDDRQGVILVAEDGRNITLEFDTLTAAATGVGAANTYVGTYSLYTTDGSAVSIEHQVGNEDTFGSSGFRLGSFSADVAQMVTINRDTGTSAGALEGDTLVINDIAIAAARDTLDTASADTDLTTGNAITQSIKSRSAIAIAAAINEKTSLHGVTAVAEANVLRGSSFTADDSLNGDLYINGVTVEGVSGGNRNAIIDKINEYSGQTGVVARAYGEAVELVAEDGRNISLAAGGTLTAASLGLTDVLTVTGAGNAETSTTYYASVRLTSDKAFTVERGNQEDPTDFEALGFRVGTFGGSDTGMKIAEINVGTQLGASMAITAIDAAINDVAGSQARSGAFQNRLESTISVLSESVENTTASRSRILDTDYAQETTALARSQIIQQAATAMLAQANQQSQSVLALLQ